jgi:hypothetical protein
MGSGALPSRPSINGPAVDASVSRLSTSSITFGILYLGQKYFTRQLPGMKTRNIVLSSAAFSLLTGGRLVPS